MRPSPRGTCGRQSDIGTGLFQVFQFSHQYRSINVQYAPFPTVRAVESCRYQ